MELIPSESDVLTLLETTGALRHGHFRFPAGHHSDRYLQLPLVMRHFNEAKALSVGLSRLLRADDEIRRVLPAISIVTPATAGLPVAFGVAEALRASMTYWAEKEEGKLVFRQFMETHAGERVVLVDDLLRSGRKLRELRRLVEASGARVLAMAVLVWQPEGEAAAGRFEGLPVHSLLRLTTPAWSAEQCPLCREKAPIIDVRA